MKRKIKAGMYTARSANIRKRIARNRRRAKLSGLLYLVGVLVLAATACFPFLVHDLAPIGVLAFYQAFLPANLKGVMQDQNKLVALINSVLYALMLLVVLVNALKSLGKLRWLFKKRGSKAYGFNRNVYAMEDIGNYFSGSFAMIICTYVLIALFCGKFAINLLGLIVLAGGVVIHLLAGFMSAKSGYYDIQRGEIVECQRQVGRIAPMIRNLVQLVAVAAVIFFIDYEGLGEILPTLTSLEGIQNLMSDMNTLLVFAAQMVAILCLFVLVKHATGLAEFNIDGAYGEGMKNFRIFSFFLLIAAGGAVAIKLAMIMPGTLDIKLLIIAGVGLVTFIVELVMRNMPKFIEFEMFDSASSNDEDEEFYF